MLFSCIAGFRPCRGMERGPFFKGSLQFFFSQMQGSFLFLLKALSKYSLAYYLDMEDSHTEILSLREDKGTAFFGVYDGHGGTCRFNVLLSIH